MYNLFLAFIVVLFYFLFLSNLKDTVKSSFYVTTMTIIILLSSFFDLHIIAALICFIYIATSFLLNTVLVSDKEIYKIKRTTPVVQFSLVVISLMLAFYILLVFDYGSNVLEFLPGSTEGMETLNVSMNRISIFGIILFHLTTVLLTAKKERD